MPSAPVTYAYLTIAAGYLNLYIAQLVLAQQSTGLAFYYALLPAPIFYGAYLLYLLAAQGAIETEEYEYTSTRRENAATYAIQRSRDNLEEFEYGTTDGPASLELGSVGGPFCYIDVEHKQGKTGSSAFISEILHLGANIPMAAGRVGATECSNEGEDTGSQHTGWRVCCESGDVSSNRKNTTKSWRSHPDIMSYFLDTALPIEDEPSRCLALSNPPNNSDTVFYSVLNEYMNFNTGRWRSTLQQAGESYLYDLFNVGGLLHDIDTGDYIYIYEGIVNPGQSNQVELHHGFFIVGWGEACECPDALNAQTTANNINATFSVTRQHNGLEVPYVVDFCYGYSISRDWTGWLQDPRPRPFYCSAVELASDTLNRPDGSDPDSTSDNENEDYYGYVFQDYMARLRGGLSLPPFEPFLLYNNDCDEEAKCRPDWRFFRMPEKIIVINPYNPTGCADCEA